ARAFIRAGQTLTIPTAGGGAAPATTTTPAPSTSTSTSTSTTHTVVAGDTVSGIATRYGSTVAAIVSANSLNRAAQIRIGQALTVPSATTTAAATTTLVGNTFAGRTYPEATVASANQNKATLLELGVP